MPLSLFRVLISIRSIFLLFLLFSTPSVAQEFDINGPIEPSLIEKAETGDAYANYLLGYKYYLLRDADSVEKSLEYLLVAQKAYAAAGEGSLYDLAGILNLIGSAYLERSEYALAIATFEQAIEINDGINAVLNRGFNEQALGMALQGLSRYQDAVPFFEQARASFIAVEGPDGQYIGDTYLNEGISWEGLGNYTKALVTYSEARRHYESTFGADSAVVGYTTNNIAWVLRKLNNFDQSYEKFREALTIIDRYEGHFSVNGGKVRINLGIVEYQRGNVDAAIRWTMRAMPFIRANLDITLSDQRWAFDTLARGFRAKGDPKRAIAFAKLAVNAHQSIRSKNSELVAEDTAKLNDEWRWLYQHLADLLIEHGRISEAQAVLNMAKEQEVFEFLRRDASADVNQTRAVLNDAELSEEQKIASIAKMPIGAASELLLLMTKLENGDATEKEEDRIFLLQDAIQAATDRFEAEVDAFLAELEPQGAEEIQDQMAAVGAYQSVLTSFDQKVAILQIASIADSTHLFLTLPNVTIHEKVDISKADLSRLVFNALQAIEARSEGAQSQLKALHDVLLAPVAEALAQSDTQVIMLNLDGFLRYVPFAALFDGQKYAVEDFAFALYSTAVPTQFSRSNRMPAKTVGFGVTRAHPGFSALPGVRHELDTIFLGEDADGVLTGRTGLDADFDQRQLKRALLRRPEILHIASHFNLVPGREDDSFLLLGDGEHLLLSEIRRKKALSFRGVDLLTLSACQTALGSGDGSEIEGFAATAQLNGASAVMASLWPVSDAATPLLMRAFYRGMFNHDLSKAEALQNAQINLLAGDAPTPILAERGAESLDEEQITGAETGFAHPYYWSAFILMGNWL